MGALAKPMQAVCCSSPATCDEGGLPSECTPDCVGLFLMFYNRCSAFLRENSPEFLAFGRDCQEQQLGLSPSSASLEPVGKAEWPPCETDTFGSEVCAELLADGMNSCDNSFCADCPLAGKCDQTCALPCPDGVTQWPPAQPFLLCYAATCTAPAVENPVQFLLHHINIHKYYKVGPTEKGRVC